MDKKFRRILDLVRRSGDRMIVTDPEGDDAFVVMGLEDYEVLMELEQFAIASEENFEEEGEFLDDYEDAPLPSETPGIFDVMQPAGQGGPTWDLSAMSEAERAEVERQFRAQSEPEKPREIRVEVPSEPVSDSKNEDDDEFGEEQFYLEPVE